MFYLVHNQTPFYPIQFNNFFINYIYIKKLYTAKVYCYYTFLFINQFPLFFTNKLKIFLQTNFGNVINYFWAITWISLYWKVFISSCATRELPHNMQRRYHLNIEKKELFFYTNLYEA